MSEPITKFFTTGHVIAIVAIVGIGLWGLFLLRRDILTINSKIRFNGNFSTNFNTFVETRGSNADAYNWLLLHSYKMQSMMGVFALGMWGSVALGREPYEVILRGISDLKSDFDTNSPDLNARLNFVVETLVRYCGVLSNQHDHAMAELRNPVCWLRRGLQNITQFPLSILEIIGLLGADQASKWNTSRPYKLMISVVGFLAAFKTLAPDQFDSTLAYLVNLVGWS